MENNQLHTLESIYRHIDSYVMLVNEDSAVLNANFFDAQEMREKENLVYRIGEILRCSNAIEANGCGLHKNCGLCSIRKAIIQTFRKKKGFHKIESHIKFQVPDGRSDDLYTLFSTSYIDIEGEPRVVLTLNNITEMIKQYKILPNVDLCQNNVNPDKTLPKAFADLLAQEEKM